MRHREASTGTTVTLDAAMVRGLAYREVNVREAFTLVDAGGTSFRASLKSLEQGSGTAEVYERIVGDTPGLGGYHAGVRGARRQRMIPVCRRRPSLAACAWCRCSPTTA